MDTNADLGHRRRLERFRATWHAPTGLPGWFATVNNTSLGARYMVTSLAFFFIAGVMALFMRTQLAVPDNTFLDPDTYNQLFTMHGSTMMYLFVVPFLEGLANFILPALIGSRDLAYPRVTAFGYWVYLFGGIVFFSSFLVDAVPDVGWFAYPPLSGADFSGLGTDFWLLGLGAIELAGIATGIELSVSILKLRAPGMSLNRMPLFAWAVLVMALSIIFAFTTLLLATLLLELDRSIGTSFFDPAGGGNPVLWQHLFWIFGHPEVYIMFIPATGIVSMIVPTFARRPIAGYTLVVVAIVLTGFVSFGLWVHHMFTTGLPLLAASFFTASSAMIALASGIQIFAWIGTLWGSRPALRAPLLFVLGFVFIFVLGGITGVMVASLPFDWQVHDTYFVVAHFHYVLIGGVVFPIFAALYYWMPQIGGRMLNERLGAWNFWLMFIGFNLTFFPMHISGFLGMPRRVYTYGPNMGLELPNLLSTAGSFVLGLGFAMFLVNYFVSGRSRHRPIPENPWNAGTLEWTAEQPTPNYTFVKPPVVYDRYPAWHEPGSDARDEGLEALADSLTAAPSDYRATLVTSVLGARPQGLWHLSGPSYTPIVLALGVTLVALGPVTKVYWLMGLGAAMAVLALAVWLWPSPPERERLLHDELNERLGLPLTNTGSRELGWWGVLFFIIVVAVLFALLFFSYFYIRIYSPDWPQGGISPPDWRLPALALFVLAASVIAGRIAAAGLARGRQPALRLGLAVAVILGFASLGMMVFELLQLDFRPDANAYASLFWVIAAFTRVAVLIGLGLMSGVLLRAYLGHFDRENGAAVRHAVMYWSFSLVAAAASFSVLYLSPGFG